MHMQGNAKSNYFNIYLSKDDYNAKGLRLRQFSCFWKSIPGFLELIRNIVFACSRLLAL
jgi:hypothetical protein